MRDIPLDNLSYAVLISISNGTSWSGYFVRSKERLFLVTAKHVIFNQENWKLNGENMNIVWYTSNIEDDDTIEYEASLQQLLEKKSVIQNDKDDVVVIFWGHLVNWSLDISKKPEIKITKKPTKWSGITATIENMKKINEALTGNNIFIVGYPSSIWINYPPAELGGYARFS